MILLDTNVPSETSKIDPDADVLEWLAANNERLRLPTIVLAELRYGVEKLPPSRKRTRLEKWLANEIDRFHERMIDFDAASANAHGQLRARLNAIGKAMHAPDSYIAAVALAHRLPLATRNTSHFVHAQIELIDPSTA